MLVARSLTGRPEVRIHQHLRQRSAYGPRSNHGAGWAGADEITGEVVEVDLVWSSSRPVTCAQCLSTLPVAVAGTARKARPGLVERQPRPPGFGVWLCGHGWLGRRSGRGARAVCRLEPVEVPGQRSSNGEDPRSHHAVRHLPYRIPRLCNGRCGARLDGLYRRCRTGRVGAAASAFLLGAAVVIVGDLIAERLAQARSFGCETIDVSQGNVKEQIAQIVGEPEVDSAVDAVGFEARGHEPGAAEAPATVLNTVMEVTRAGGKIGIPGLYVTGDPGGVDEAAKEGALTIRIGLGWARSHEFVTGQCPVMRYNRQLMMAILHDRVQIAKAVNATPIPLDRHQRATPSSMRVQRRSTSWIHMV